MNSVFISQEQRFLVQLSNDTGSVYNHTNILREEIALPISITMIAESLFFICLSFVTFIFALVACNRQPVKAHSIRIIFWRLLTSALFSLLAILVVVDADTRRWIDVIRTIFICLMPEVSLIPMLFRFWNIYFTFYLYHLLIQRAADTQSASPTDHHSHDKHTSEAAEAKRKQLLQLERRIRIVQFLNSYTMSVIGFILYAIPFFVQLAVLLPSVFVYDSTRLLRTTIYVCTTTSVILFVSFIIIVGYLLIQMYRIGVSENYGIVRSIIFTIIAMIAICVLLITFAALSVILPDNYNARVTVFIVLVLVANVEPNLYVTSVVCTCLVCVVLTTPFLFFFIDLSGLL